MTPTRLLWGIGGRCERLVGSNCLTIGNIRSDIAKRSSSLETLTEATKSDEKRDHIACNLATGPRYQKARSTPRKRKRRGYLSSKGRAPGRNVVMMYSGRSIRLLEPEVIGLRMCCRSMIWMRGKRNLKEKKKDRIQERIKFGPGLMRCSGYDQCNRREMDVDAQWRLWSGVQ